jgi:hypothetical protein
VCHAIIVTLRWLLFLAQLPGSNQIQGTIHADPVNPRPKRRPSVKTMQLLKCPQECLLHKVFRVLLIAAHAKGQSENGVAMPFHQHAIGAFISGARSVYGILVAPLHLPVLRLAIQLPVSLA